MNEISNSNCRLLLNFNISGTLTSKGMESELFPSFYFLLDKLRELNIPYTILLRTFGIDLVNTVNKIKNKNTDVKSFSICRLEMESLIDKKNGIIEGVENIFCHFLNSNAGTHFAIVDDLYTWSAIGNKHPNSGMPYIYDSSGCFHDVKNISFFFSTINCIRPVDLSDEPQVGCERVIFVNTSEAMSKNDYYFNIISTALQNFDM